MLPKHINLCLLCMQYLQHVKTVAPFCRVNSDSGIDQAAQFNNTPLLTPIFRFNLYRIYQSRYPRKAFFTFVYIVVSMTIHVIMVNNDVLDCLSRLCFDLALSTVNRPRSSRMILGTDSAIREYGPFETHITKNQHNIKLNCNC